MLYRWWSPNPGSIKSWQDVSLKICGWGSDFESYCNSYRMERERVFLSLPRLGEHESGYRYLSNERVKEDTNLAGHFHSRPDRFAATDSDSPVLILRDTTGVYLFANRCGIDWTSAQVVYGTHRHLMRTRRRSAG